jgi:hypothetical protein
LPIPIDSRVFLAFSCTNYKVLGLILKSLLHFELILVQGDRHGSNSKETLEEISEKFMEKILDLVYQNIQDALKKFQDSKNKEHEKTQKQINELRKDFNKHQSETKDIIK